MTREEKRTGLRRTPQKIYSGLFFFFFAAPGISNQSSVVSDPLIKFVSEGVKLVPSGGQTQRKKGWRKVEGVRTEKETACHGESEDLETKKWIRDPSMAKV